MDAWMIGALAGCVAIGVALGVREARSESQEEKKGPKPEPGRPSWLAPMLGNAAVQALDDFNAGQVSSFAELLRADEVDERLHLRASALFALIEYVDLNAAEAWTQAEPEEALAWLSLGARQVMHAWEARGSGKAETVTSDGFDDFHARLELAKQSLERAAGLDDADPTPYAWLISVGMGLQLPSEELQAIYQAALKRHPDSFAAHGAFVQAGASKWGGDNDEMLGAIRAASEAAPAGSATHALLFAAHGEQWSTLEAEDEASAREYAQSTPVRTELAEAYRRFNSADPKGPSALQARNMIVEWCYLVDDLGLLREQLDKVGDALSFAHGWPDPQGTREQAEDMATAGGSG